MVTFHQVTPPSNSKDGLSTPALRFGDPRVMAVLASLVGFCHFVEGFSTLLDPKLPDHLKRRSPLATAWRKLDGALDDFTNRKLLAA